MSPDLIVNLVSVVAATTAISSLLGFVRDTRKDWLLTKWKHLKNQKTKLLFGKRLALDALFLGSMLGVHELLHFTISTHMPEGSPGLFYLVIKKTYLFGIVIVVGFFMISEILSLIRPALQDKDDEVKGRKESQP